MIYEQILYISENVIVQLFYEVISQFAGRVVIFFSTLIDGLSYSRLKWMVWKPE